MLAFFLLKGVVYSRTDIKSFTLMITDTSHSEYQQAKDIYSWIIVNIRLDAKAYKNHEHPDLSPEHLLRKRKGLSPDFAELMVAMSNALGIEAYAISGYAKGVHYFGGKPFIRSNHSWVVLFIDSLWIHADPAAGSGMLSTKPRFGQKVTGFFGFPFSNSKMFFKSSPDTAWFDVPPDTLVASHYPLDPKWLLTENPPGFYSFQDTAIVETVFYPDYLEEIERIRKDKGAGLPKIEGENGLKYNRLNYYDRASGLFKQARQYDTEREITKSNLWQFEKYQTDYGLVVQSISRHRTINDSVYRMRFRDLKSVASKQKRLTKKIKSKLKSARKSYGSSRGKISSRSKAYRKKINSYAINIGRAELKKIEIPDTASVTHGDAGFSENLADEVLLLSNEQSGLVRKTDSLVKAAERKIRADALLDDSLFIKNNEFNLEIISLSGLILSGNEASIRKYADSLQFIYRDITDIITEKRFSSKKMKLISRDFTAYSGQLQKSFSTELTLYRTYLKKTDYDGRAVRAHNAILDRQIAAFKKSMQFLKMLELHNTLQKDVRADNLRALKDQKRNIVKEDRLFNAWFNNIYEREKTLYTSEKELIKEIQRPALRNLKIVEMKLRKYREKNDNG